MSGDVDVAGQEPVAASAREIPGEVGLEPDVEVPDVDGWIADAGEVPVDDPDPFVVGKHLSQVQIAMDRGAERAFRGSDGLKGCQERPNPSPQLGARAGEGLRVRPY